MKYIITMKLYICKEHNNIVINFSETLTGYTHIRLLECKLNNSWYNITNENNEIVFSIDNKNSTKVIEPGNYNVETLSQAIGRTKLINFKRVLPTGKTQMILDDKVKVNFSRPKNFARILGFKEIEYSKSGISPYKANFLPVTEYVVRCNLIDTPTNYINDKRSNYLQVLTLQDKGEIGKAVTYSFPTSVPVPIKKTDITSLRIWITGQNEELINFNGYPISFQLELI